jgi:methionyl aminopeptidase
MNAFQVERMREVGSIAAHLLDVVEEAIHPGITTEEIDALVDRVTRAAGADSAPFGYRGFPKHVCTSINEVVCHGIPRDDQVLCDGDIVNVDVTPVLDGFHGDSSRTFYVGAPSAVAHRLVETTREALWRGIRAVRPGATLGDLGYAIQSFAEGRGFSVVRDFTGHGIGRIFHTAPTVHHVGRPGGGERLRPGMTFTIEPMINAGDWHVEVLADGWTAVTRDRSLSAQFEHTVIVTDTGVEVLTLSERERDELARDPSAVPLGVPLALGASPSLTTSRART